MMAVGAIKANERNEPVPPEDRLRAAQITQVYSQSLLGGAGALLGGTVLMAMLWYDNPRPLMIVWVLSYLAIYACRILLVKSFRKARPTEKEILIWGRRHCAITLSSNILWGFAAIFLFPLESLHLQIFFVIFIGGIVSGAAAIYSPTNEYWGNILLALVPLSGSFFYHGGQPNLMVGALLLMFGLLMAITAMNVHRLYAEVFTLRFEKDDLIEDLRAEIAERTETLALMTKLRVEAEAASAAKTGFLTNMSHELRTPLNAILGFAELLTGQFYGKLNNKQLEHVREISDAGHHFLKLINEILDLARVESGKMDLEISEVWLGQFLENTLTMIRETAVSRSLAVHLHVPEDLAGMLIRADEVKLKRIILNLLANAAKFTPGGGHITLAADRKGDELLISVSDTGIGIRPEDQMRIFEAFEQVDSGFSRRESGTGLGLALVRKLVELHGGKVWVESAGPDKGSNFRFTIPYAPVGKRTFEDSAPENTASVAESGQWIIDGDHEIGPTVLVVEDNHANMRLMVNLLKAGGYKTLMAYSAEEGIRIAENYMPALILMDLSLPGMDGLAATRALKQENSTAHIPVIALTAHAMKDDELKGLEAGCDAYLVKPIDTIIFFKTLSGFVKASEKEPRE